MNLIFDFLLSFKARDKDGKRAIDLLPHYQEMEPSLLERPVVPPSISPLALQGLLNRMNSEMSSISMSLFSSARSTNGSDMIVEDESRMAAAINLFDIARLFETATVISEAPPVERPIPSEIRADAWTAKSDGFARDYDLPGSTTSQFSLASMMSEANIVRALLLEADSHIRHWQRMVELETELLKPIPCWLSCGYIGKSDLMVTHVREECPLRKLHCDQCREVFLSRDLDRHMRRECPERRVGCPNALDGCRQLVALSELQSHLELRCLRRRVCCRLNCGAMVAFADRDRK